MIGSLAADSIACLRQLYSKLYPNYAAQFSEGQISLSSTFRKYSDITWQGKNLTSTLNKNAKNPFVFVVPLFFFTISVPTEFKGKERLAVIDFFVVHSVVLPNTQEPKSHLLACDKWPMVHPEHLYFGKPIEVWCHNIYVQNTSQLMGSFWHPLSLHVLLSALKKSLVNRFVLRYHLLSNFSLNISYPCFVQLCV